MAPPKNTACAIVGNAALSQTQPSWKYKMSALRVITYIRDTDREFRVCKSVHHHTFNWINQPDAANSQVYYLSFKYSSTCFGHPHAHHQELQQLQ
jgi:hypothetical protein